MRKNFAVAFMTAILILNVYGINESHATSFSDSFDDPAYTSANWDVVIPGWNFVTLSDSDLGYQGTNAVSFADNQQYYYQTDLMVEFYVRLEDPGSGVDDIDTFGAIILISGSIPNDYREYTVGISIDDDTGEPIGGLGVHNFASDGSVNQSIGDMQVDISFGTLYRLIMETDSQGDINVYLYDEEDVLLASLTEIELLTPFDSGMVGLATERVATFNDFSITGVPVPEPTIDIHPDTLNLKSKGKWVTCYIELPEGHDVTDIILETVAITKIDGVSLESSLYIDLFGPTEVGDYDGDDLPDLMVEFDRESIQNALTEGAVEITVGGQTNDGAAFEGVDTVLVINKGKEHNNENHGSVVY